MRGKLRLLILIIITFFFADTIYAEKIECDYPNLELKITWDTSKEFNSKSNPFVEMGGYDSSSTYFQIPFLLKIGKKVKLTEAAEIDQKLYKEVLENYGCNDKMRVCIYTEASMDVMKTALVADIIDTLYDWEWDDIESLTEFTQSLKIMTEEEYEKSDLSKFEGGLFGIIGSDEVELRWRDGYNFGDVFKSIGDLVQGISGAGENHHFLSYRETNCEIAKYDGPYVGVNINCASLTDKNLEYIKVKKEFEVCSEVNSCKLELTNRVNTLENDMKAICAAILENFDYNEAQSDCLDYCLKMPELLRKFNNRIGECGFSGRLLSFFSNILRWIKYILPVIVIVLGIIDFMKATMGNKEDEIKKAQQRFIRRIIAAALLFIVPLILEFVLDKMGFGYDDCGLF